MDNVVNVVVLCLQAFHEKLESKRDNAMEVIQKCSHMLRETTKEEGDVAKGRIEHVRSLIGMKFEYRHMPKTSVNVVVSYGRLKAWLVSLLITHSKPKIGADTIGHRSYKSQIERTVGMIIIVRVV